ncbi:MAG: metal-dependent transcriptional regulator [Clostridiales bacterium]|nr:metal-dependent transcriptional regulator [Clostridiales bacterium]
MHESGEDYLETILILKNRQGFVRSIDVANELGFSKPSISRAMSILRDNGYITIELGGNIVLTDKGKETAGNVYERHVLITEFFVKVLGVDKEIAEKDACKIEHDISDETFLKMKKFLKNSDSQTG